MNTPDKQVFFHVGLGKVASTYLQYRFFPRLRGLHYIQRTQYWRYAEIIHKSGDTKFLISREFDRQLEEEVRKFATEFPDGQVIILLRRHDGWIASQYRRFVKNGMYMTFDEFIDLEREHTFWKKEEMTFYPMLQMLERVMGRPPLVFFYHDLRENPEAFFDAMAAAMDVDYPRGDISLRPVHRSYTEKQLKVIRRFRLYDMEPYGNMRNPVDWLRRKWRFLVCYAILYPAALLPKALAPKGDLIPRESLSRIRENFAEDWDRCLAYAARTQNTPSRKSHS
jgi:hypothetical protein